MIKQEYKNYIFRRRFYFADRLRWLKMLDVRNAMGARAGDVVTDQEGDRYIVADFNDRYPRGYKIEEDGTQSETWDFIWFPDEIVEVECRTRTLPRRNKDAPPYVWPDEGTEDAS